MKYRILQRQSVFSKEKKKRNKKHIWSISWFTLKISFSIMKKIKILWSTAFKYYLQYLISSRKLLFSVYGKASMNSEKSFLFSSRISPKFKLVSFSKGLKSSEVASIMVNNLFNIINSNSPWIDLKFLYKFNAK